MEKTIIRKIIKQSKRRRVRYVCDRWIVCVHVWAKKESSIPNLVVINPQYNGGIKFDKLSCHSTFMYFKKVEYQLVMKPHPDAFYV